MSKNWLEALESYLAPKFERAVKEGEQAINDLALHVHLSHWHPGSTAPSNQELELRVAENGEFETLGFPCLRTNNGAWINVDLGTEIRLQPVEWRVWQHAKSPNPHHSKIKPDERATLFHLHSPQVGQDNDNDKQ
jgi:hypothetical protein